MHINYVKTVNDIYNSSLNIERFQHKFITIANAVEQFDRHSQRVGEHHPLYLKARLLSVEDVYAFGRKNFGLFYASIFIMYLKEV